MRKTIGKAWVKCLVTGIIGLALAYAYVSPRWAYALTDEERYHVLCDAFSLPGIFMVLIGLMCLMGNLGALDTISYAFHHLLHTFIPATGKRKSYLEYVEDRRENRMRGYGFLFIVGGIFLAVGFIMLFLYYQV